MSKRAGGRGKKGEDKEEEEEEQDDKLCVCIAGIKTLEESLERP